MAVWSNLFYISLSLCTARVVSVNIQVSPLNATVLKGSDAQFNATVQGEWKIMTWRIGENLVLVFSSNDTIEDSASDKFSATLCFKGNTTCVEFTIRNVARTEAGEITCSVVGSESNPAHLYVQESGTVNIRGGNVTVALNHQVEFQCNISAWYPEPDVGWALNGAPVDSSQYNTTSMLDGDLYYSTSVLNFKAVSNADVECWANVSALSDPITSSVFLVVVPPDWTVLISVVVSIGGFALLVLLIIGIVFCYRRRKEKQSNYKDEMTRRVRTQSEINGMSAPGQEQGHVNGGYLPEGQASKTGGSHSDLFDTQRNVFSISEIPSDSSHRGYGNVFINTVHGQSLAKHRHATIV